MTKADIFTGSTIRVVTESTGALNSSKRVLMGKKGQNVQVNNFSRVTCLFYTLSGRAVTAGEEVKITAILLLYFYNI
jgi:TolB-like protein